MFKTIKRLIIATALVCLAKASFAFGNDDSWVSGWGMGTKEAVVTNGPGNEIYVACDEGSSLSSSIRFILGGDSPKGHAITLTFDGSDPEDFWLADDLISSDCRACAANFDRVIQLLKSHKSVHVRFENGLSSKFNLAGSGEAIGECIAGFYK